jgi:hypothetical protein
VSGPVRETLDETIDRVAATLTAVPADPGFGDRLAARLEPAPRGWRTTWLVVSAAAAVVLLALIVGARREGPSPLPQVAAVHDVPAQKPPPELSHAAASVADSGTAGAFAETQRLPQLDAVEAPAAPPSAIAALPAPHTIAVETLALQALDVAPVDIGQIDVASLEIREIDVNEEPKE